MHDHHGFKESSCLRKHGTGGRNVSGSLVFILQAVLFCLSWISFFANILRLETRSTIEPAWEILRVFDPPNFEKIVKHPSFHLPCKQSDEKESDTIAQKLCTQFSLSRLYAGFFCLTGDKVFVLGEWHNKGKGIRRFSQSVAKIALSDQSPPLVLSSLPDPLGML